MSPKKKKKLAHQTHFDELDVKNDKIPVERGIKKFSVQIIDLQNVLDWECDHYKEVYN